MNHFTRLVYSVFLSLILFSCATTKVAVEEEKLERRKTADLLHVLDSIAIRKPDFFYSKITTEYSDTNRSINLKTSLRMVKDSAINLLITYMKLPIVNSIITKDSLTVVNKKDKC